MRDQKYLRQALFFVISVFISILYLNIATAADCTPAYECSQWGSCLEGIQERICTEMKCDYGSTVERRLCLSDSQTCDVSYKCSEWTECLYTTKTEDILQSSLRFAGYQERNCVDANLCADSFVEDRVCTDDFKVRFEKVEQCGTSFLVAFDSNSNTRVSKVDLGNLIRKKRLDISFTQGDVSYCAYCYNGQLDGDEAGIDCGGSCKECATEIGLSERTVLVSGSWLISLVLVSGFVSSAILHRRLRMFYLIYQAYRALERNDKKILAVHIASIKALYRTLKPKQRESFQKDLEILYRRL